MKEEKHTGTLKPDTFMDAVDVDRETVFARVLFLTVLIRAPMHDSKMHIIHMSVHVRLKCEILLTPLVGTFELLGGSLRSGRRRPFRRHLGGLGKWNDLSRQYRRSVECDQKTVDGGAFKIRTE